LCILARLEALALTSPLEAGFQMTGRTLSDSIGQALETRVIIDF